MYVINRHLYIPEDVEWLARKLSANMEIQSDEKTPERCTIQTIRHSKDTHEPEYDIPHNPWMVRYVRTRAFSSAHLAGHLRTGMGHVERVTAYPVGVLMTKKDRRHINELK